jgi:O-antigen/teichoic acid export membrane protein
VAPGGTAAPRSDNRARGFVRGSSLLLIGRLISVGVNFLVQVLAVRYLAKSDFGALSWALSVSAIGSSVILLGLNRGVAQLAPQHHEKREFGAMFGTMALALGTVAGLGFAVVALALGFRGLILPHAQSQLSVALLLILIGLTPIDALDALLETLMAAFAGARAIFFRRYALGPAMKLGAVLLVIALRGSVYVLAWAYLVSGLLGMLLYVVLLRQVLARKGLMAELRKGSIQLAPRELFGLSLPLLSTDLLMAIETPLVAVFLEHWRSTLEVAELRAVAPVAGLVLLVLQNSKILFRPHAARLLARGDEVGLGELYWRSTAWMTVVTFPMFAVCFFLAEPITLLMFGPAYAHAGPLLAILAAGNFVNAALGMNTFTLQVHARVWLVVMINALSALLALAGCFLLIPRFGAIGGAAATAFAIVVRNAVYQIALIVTTRVGAFPRPAVRLYASVGLATACLALLSALSDSPFVLAPAIALACAAVPWFNRGYLDVGDTFPELAQVPWLGRLVRVRARGEALSTP